MRVTTRLRDATPPLIEHDPPLAWISEHQAVVGFGEAFRISAGLGAERFDRAEQAYRDWIEGCRIDDELDLPGTGPVAFASFTFDSRSPGSVLIVPEVTFGRSGGRWYVTTVGDADPTGYLTAQERPDVERDRPRFAERGSDRSDGDREAGDDDRCDGEQAERGDLFGDFSNIG